MIDIKRVIRYFVISLCFLCLTVHWKIPQREFHMLLFSIGSFAIFGLLLRNIWLTLFLWWTCFLFIASGFKYGQIYVVNIFCGCLLYYFTKISFEKKHIPLLINAILWVLAVNLLYGIVQITGYDFCFKGAETVKFLSIDFLRKAPHGFMLNTFAMAALISMAFPLLLARWNLLSKIACISLLLPIYILHNTSSMIAIIVSSLFILWFKVSKVVWIGLIILLIVCGVLFLTFVDSPKANERFNQWRMVLLDAKLHPILGWGLDSFRSFNDKKFHIYAFDKDPEVHHNVNDMDGWDNPHNLFISLAFEFGFFVPFILLGAYLYGLGKKIRFAIKDEYVLGLTGFIIAFFVVSMGGFPIFLARMAVLIVPVFGLLETQLT